MPPSPPPAEAERTAPLADRYDLLRKIGEGGMGIVYEAFDRRARLHVALKTIPALDAGSIYRTKREFRALADVRHPNLVELYDLVVEGEAGAERLFFTMELIEGVDFIQHVRFGASTVYGDTQPWDPPWVSGEAPVVDAHAAASILDPGSDPPGELDLGRLRAALAKLSQGVDALHAVGKLHRDIKPSNVLVTTQGRVVLLDFGLVTDLSPNDRLWATEHAIAGTAEYMAPEHAAGATLSEAADWYSVGVMLYEALTRQLPFRGSRLQLLLEKQRVDPPAPRDLVPGVPDDLNELCVALLRRDPTARPSGRDVLARVGATPNAPAKLQSGSGSISVAAPFVGRDRHMASLARAFHATRRGTAVTAHVRGRSGMGKSVLVRRFLSDLAARGDAIVLAGRCFERESVPYKAVDSIVDALSQYLRALPPDDVGALLPREISGLSRVFPVLRRVTAVANARRRGLDSPDPQELRRRAFGALREMLMRIADRRPLVLWIDDLQWGDVDSAALLAELMRAPEPPPLLLIVSYRSEDAPANAPNLALPPASGEEAAEIVRIDLDALTRGEAAALARSLLGEGSEAEAEAIADESGGSPFFVHELARHVQLRPGGERAGITLEALLAERVEALDEEARRLLKVIAVAGRPIARDLAIAAAETPGDRERATVGALVSASLIRTLRHSDREEMETFHDRIREAVVALLDEGEQASVHARIASAMETSGKIDVERLAVHHRGAGALERAGECAHAAAERAMEALAFDRAAMWYRVALELRPALDPASARGARRKLADALVNAGRGADAAREYLAAAAGANAADALDLRRRAAEQLLQSGHIDDGATSFREVLAAVGMKLPATMTRALLAFVLLSLLLLVRGLRFKKRDESQIAPEGLTRIDVCWSVAVGLGMVDHVRANVFIKRHLLLSLRAGDLYRVALGLALEVAGSSRDGAKAAPRTARLAERAQCVAEESAKPHALGFIQTTRGLAAYLEGRWEDSLALSERAVTLLRDQCTGVTWEVNTSSFFSLFSLFHLGRMRELVRRVPPLINQARERGDLYALTNLRAGLIQSIWLAADDAPRAAREVDEAMSAWSQGSTTVQHYYELQARVHIDLYQGRGAEAVARVDALWPSLARALLFHVQYLRVEALHLRARAHAAAALACDGAPAEAHRAAALADVHAIERAGASWCVPLAQTVRAAVDAQRGDVDGAKRGLTRAIAALESMHMALWAAAAQRALGSLVGGDEGREAIARAEAIFVGEGVRDPERMSGMLVPGVRAR